MKAYEYVKNYVNVKISPSTIQGVGVFALRDIEKGEDLFVNWTGETGLYQLTESELNSLDYGVKMHLYDMFEFCKVGEDWEFTIFLEKNCHWIFKTPIHWVNSCSWDSEPNIDRGLYVTTKKIIRGNELFTKYGKYEKNRLFRTI
jgi:hypothetical protein